MGHPVRTGTATSPPGSSAARVQGHTSPLKPAVVNGTAVFPQQSRGGGPPWPAWHPASRWATFGKGQGGLTLKHSRVPRRVISAQGGGERGRTPTHTLGGGGVAPPGPTAPSLCTEQVARACHSVPTTDVSGLSTSAALPVGPELRVLVGPPALTSASTACPSTWGTQSGQGWASPEALFSPFQTRVGQVPGAPWLCECL